jgi:hypothetical protein
MHTTWPQEHGLAFVLKCFHAQLALTMLPVDHVNQDKRPWVPWGGF